MNEENKQPSPAAAKTWVKASGRMPKYYTAVSWKYDGERVFVRPDENENGYFFVIDQSGHSHRTNEIDGLEWLEEQQPSPAAVDADIKASAKAMYSRVHESRMGSRMNAFESRDEQRQWDYTTGFEDGYKELKQQPSPAAVEWVKLEEGCKLPDYDHPVLWLFEDGNMYVEALDKDGNPRLFGQEREIEGFPLPKATHWRELPQQPDTFTQIVEDQSLNTLECADSLDEAGYHKPADVFREAARVETPDYTALREKISDILYIHYGEDRGKDELLELLKQHA